jgi:hypothetical protein
VTDLVLMGVSSAGSTYSIEDDEYGSSNLLVSDAYVGMYAIGAQISSSPAIYAHFNTSKEAPSLLSGASSVSGSCSTVANGTLYSNSASGATSGVLSLCVNGSWFTVK